MEDNRKFTRLPAQLSARYLKADKEEWKDCSVINISHEGMCVGVCSQEKTEMCSTLQLEISVPKKKEPIASMGTIMWVKELKGDKKFNFLAGVKLIAINPEDTWRLLDYANQDGHKKKKR
jgi:hypothetical protein